jgi:hypothetical protein
MAWTFAAIRTAIDILNNRMPGALAMGKAREIGISVHTRAERHWCTVTFHFDHDRVACGNAYRAIERLYEMERNQDGPQGKSALTSGER